MSSKNKFDSKNLDGNPVTENGFNENNINECSMRENRINEKQGSLKQEWEAMPPTRY